MSLLNRMLNDLDERRAVPGDALRFQRDVRPLPQPPRVVWPWLLAGGALAGAAIVGAGLYLLYGPGRALPVLPAPLTKEAANAALPSLAAAAAAPLPPALSEPPAPALPPLAPVAPAAVATQPPDGAPVAGRATGHSAVDDGLRLRLSTRVSSLPAPGRDRGIASAASAPREAGTPAAEAVPAEPAESSGRIDKQAIEASPPERAERLYRSALGLLAQGRNDDGLTTVRAALREDPGHVAARQWLIKHYLDSRSFDAAQGVLQDGLAAWPQQTAWALLLSRLQADRGDNAGALGTLERVQRHAPASPELEGALGAVLQRLGRHADAEQHFAKATVIEPARARWWLGLGLAHEAQGKVAEARLAFQRAAGLKNLSPDLQAFAEQKLN